MDSEERERQIERKQRQRWIAEIEREYASLKADATVLHNKDLHKSILADWKTNSPKMWASLKKEGSYFPDKLAYVLQERMWAQYDSLVKSGMNMTDAWRIGEEGNLMLEPEDEVLTQDRLDRWTLLLTKHVLETSAQRNNEKNITGSHNRESDNHGTPHSKRFGVVGGGGHRPAGRSVPHPERYGFGDRRRRRSLDHAQTGVRMIQGVFWQAADHQSLAPASIDSHGTSSYSARMT